MSRELTDAELDDYWCQAEELLREEIAHELADRNPTKQEVIAKALKRLRMEIRNTAAIVEGAGGDKLVEKPEWYESEMSLCEFLYELPALIYILALDVYQLNASLNRALYVRWKLETDAQPPMVDNPGGDS